MVRSTIVSKAFLVLLVTSSLLTAQNPPNHRAPKIVASHPEWKASLQELFAPYWTLEPGWSTDLEVRNNVPWHDLHVIPVLRTHDGTEVALMPVDLKPEEVAPINLREAVASAKPELLDRMGSFGSVTFRFQGTAPGNGFAAAVVRRHGRPIEFHFDSEGWGSTAVEGMWWLPTESSTTYLILSNPTSKPVTGKLVLSNARGAGQQLSLTVGPRQSLRTNLREALHTPANGTFGGLSLSMLNNGEISATEIVFDEVSGQTAIMKLFDRQSLAEVDTVESRTLRAPMMALTQPDPSLGFPNGTLLDPKIFLRNAGPASMVLIPDVNWRNGSASGTALLPRITLLPGQMKVMSLADFHKSGQIPAEASWGTVTLGYTGRSGDLVAVAMSYDKTSRYGLQTPFSEVMNSLLKGSMWHVDATHNTLITAGNGGTEPTQAQVTLFYNSGQSKYRVEQRLVPGQQMWLNLGDLLRSQVPDSDGKTISPEAMFGSYELRDLGHPVLGLLYEGKLIVDKTYGHASYGCNHCCGYSQSQLSPNPFGGPPGIDNTDTYQSYSVCNARWEDFDEAFNPSSTNTGVATLNAGLNLHTVAAGGATASAKNDLPFQANRVSNCVDTNMPGNQPVTVQRPTASRITQTLSSHSVNASNFPTCTGNQAGWYRQVQKIVTDQNGADIVLNLQNLDETVTIGTPNQLNVGGVQQGTALTDSNGDFDDTFFVCSSQCPGSGQTDASQAISDILPNGSGPYNLSPNSLVYKCTGITVNGQ